MSFPSAREWLFSAKTFAAAMIALYIGLRLELPRPYWAMATVYIVSNPFVGATRSKALYRALGTMIGAAGAVLIVPPFVESPYLFSVSVALWTGTLLFLSMFDRSARSYVFLLAGYTLPLIALPAVTNPTAVFDLAITRTEEILLGIVVASVVGSVVFPSRLAPTLIERTDAWFRDAAFYASETLSGHIAGASISAARQRLAATVNGLEFLLSQLTYDHTRPDIIRRARALQGRMQIFLPLISSMADPLIELIGKHGEHPEGLEALLKDVAAWVGSPTPRAKEDVANDRAPDAFRERINAMRPPVEALASADGALLSNALWRLGQVIDVWQDIRALRAAILNETSEWRPHFRHWRLGGTARFFDRGMMLFSTGVAVSAIIVACGLWIESGWNDGAAAVTLAAVACCFFAALDEPAPQVFTFFLATCLSVVLAGLYVFAVLPHVHDFPMLVVIFAVPFLIIGTLIPRPRFTLVTMLTAVNTATFISIQSAYEADFFVFANSNLAGVAGLLFAFIWTRMTRPFGAELAAARLTRSAWADIVLSASPSVLIADQRNLYARMLDRLMQLLPRHAATDSHRHPSIESFRDFRVALNALDLRRTRRKLPLDIQTSVDDTLDALRRYFESCIARRARQPVPPELIRSIDATSAQVTSRALEQSQNAAAERWLRDTLHALVGMRLSLHPPATQEEPA
ncbi:MULTISPECIES: FUSC family protein [Caballeronia]|uniref:Fusaric acid resistance protein n=1 Tax=Caballeronia zhejiangensis TaxID=871203 RepID=A0A656QIY4_9BURK|nr:MULTISPECIES: FUSC family protein [Caballeronia]EKS70084.1 fusaric acid resistance protein region [Burkholderia sp. SJ98]KDR27526.1 fusaric acid resistance protein [Caballeronia zhejiangensis]MDR5790777.1 FUSC family protein [Caballeronia sp. LP003]